MSLFQLIALSRGSISVLWAVGVFWGGLAGMMPDIKARVGATDGEMGLVLIAPALASFIAMGIAPWAGRKLGGLALPVSGLLIPLGLLGYLWADSPEKLALVLFAGGFAVAFSDMTSNVRAAGWEAHRDLHLMNLIHGFFSVSFGLTALGIALARQAGFGVTDIAPVLAALALIYVLVGWDTRLPPEDGDDTPAARRAPLPVWLLAGALLFCAFVGENATEAWSALHIERTLGAPAGVGSFGPALLGAVMALGRFAGQAAMRVFGPARLIIGSAALGVAGAGLLAMAGAVWVAYLGVVALGLGVAVAVPSTNSIIARKVSDTARPQAIARAWMVGLLGFFIGPSLLGAIAEMASLRASFAIVALFVAAIIPAVLALERR